MNKTARCSLVVLVLLGLAMFSPKSSIAENRGICCYDSNTPQCISHFRGDSALCSEIDPDQADCDISDLDKCKSYCCCYGDIAKPEQMWDLCIGYGWTSEDKPPIRTDSCTSYCVEQTSVPGCKDDCVANYGDCFGVDAVVNPTTKPFYYCWDSGNDGVLDGGVYFSESDCKVDCVVDSCPIGDEIPTDGCVCNGEIKRAGYCCDVSGVATFCDIDCAEGIDYDCERKKMFNISLYSGWNLVSIPLKPDSWTLSSVLESISEDYVEIFTYTSGTWVELKNESKINETMGFWIKMKGDKTLQVEGQEINDTGLAIIEGWNLIGYSSLNKSLVNETFKNINYSVVYGYNNSLWSSYNPLRNDSLNTLRYLILGYAYWIKVF